MKHKNSFRTLLVLCVCTFSLLATQEIAAGKVAGEATKKTYGGKCSAEMTVLLFKVMDDKTKNVAIELIKEKQEEVKIKTKKKKKKITRGASVRFHSDDLDILEKIVMAEAGAEPYEGQVAVANVILNRVQSKHYPDTIKEVVFQKGQFTPAIRGTVWRMQPTPSVREAVREALNGKKIVADDVCFFLNIDLATDMTVPRTKKLVKKIGTHSFYK